MILNTLLYEKSVQNDSLLLLWVTGYISMYDHFSVCILFCIGKEAECNDEGA